MYRVLMIFLLFTAIGLVKSHNEGGEWSCESESENRIEAIFKPGVITIDGHTDDWKDIDGFEFSLLPALDPHQDDAYKAGSMTVKAVHDGNNVFFHVGS
ncbi:hypothetical protein C5167_017096 [Papaver somniferum]|uniref:Uncharacterized protein n=1 Tax=Papaver somniferum TaxID=3469 RepID=A0A4Y7IMI2_PAPSO|nr:hypothetical protein C5167_017096 [Papaver somniferum]